MIYSVIQTRYIPVTCAMLTLTNYYLAFISGIDESLSLFLILAEVSRLFGPYAHGGRSWTRRRTLGVPALSSYTHSFFCLDNKSADLVPNRYAKERLASAGLGGKRLTFQGMLDIMMVF